MSVPHLEGDTRSEPAQKRNKGPATVCAACPQYCNQTFCLQLAGQTPNGQKASSQHHEWVFYEAIFCAWWHWGGTSSAWVTKTLRNTLTGTQMEKFAMRKKKPGVKNRRSLYESKQEKVDRNKMWNFKQQLGHFVGAQVEHMKRSSLNHPPSPPRKMVPVFLLKKRSWRC